MSTAIETRTPGGAQLTALYNEHAAALFGRMVRYADGDRHGAEDLVQETMLRAWRGVGSLPEEPEHARRWLFTIARNVAVDAARRKRRRPLEVAGVEAARPTTDDTLETVLAVDAMRRAFGTLSTEQQTVVSELFLSGRSAAETARRLGVPIGTVKSRAHYAVRHLREGLSAYTPKDTQRAALS